MGEKTNDRFDVVVVGSGASGGWACKRLGEAGLKVALVDAGRTHTDNDYREHIPPFALKYRQRAEVVRAARLYPSPERLQQYNYDGFATISEPYTTPKEKPFSWVGRPPPPEAVPTSGGG
jgi:choline dehydrogenase-like flavoprotein